MVDQHKDSVWCTIILDKKNKLLVGCVYRSPNVSPEFDCKVNKLMVAADFKESDKLVIGDLNL